MKFSCAVIAGLLLGAGLTGQASAENDRSGAKDPLPSWNHGPARKAVVEFVERVTRQGGSDYVPPAERIAVFDNDGTLWSEQPMYVQLAFVLDRIAAMSPEHPEWKDKQPFKAVLERDIRTVAASGKKGLVELLMATHAGLTTEEFERVAGEWIATARHPKTGRPYTEMVYQPMLELLAYLRASGFKTYIVSGGGIEFMRPWAEKTYGIPPEQVIGSSIRTRFEVQDGRPVILRLPEVDFIDDKEGKPVAINRFIGRRPLAAFGNSDGDFQMLQWTTAGSGPRLGLFVHHDDGEREVAYDRESHIGQLNRGLDEADRHGWVVLSMKRDWKQVFPVQKP